MGDETHGVSEHDGEVQGVGVDTLPCKRVRARRGPSCRVVGRRHRDGGSRERKGKDGENGVHRWLRSVFAGLRVA